MVAQTPDHKRRSSAPAGAPPPPLLLGTAGFTNDPNPPPGAAAARVWFWTPQIPAWAFSFSKSLILFAPLPDLLAAAEPSDIVHKSSNPPPLPLCFFVDVGAKDGEAVDTGEATVDRAPIGLITGIAADAGAIAGVELGRTCNKEGVSVVLNPAKG